jgi:hypothetical protein
MELAKDNPAIVESGRAWVVMAPWRSLAYWQWLAVHVLAAPIIALAQPGPDAQRTLYLAPSGSDNASGASPNAALASLQHAVDRASDLLASTTGEVQIVVGRGIYRRQAATLNAPQSTKALIIRADCPEADHCAVFDGGGVRRWVTIKSSAGGNGEISIRGLAITDYLSGIATLGSRTVLKESITGVSVVSNSFRRIGQILPTATTPSTGVLVFINTSASRVEANIFREVRNRTKCGLIHAIYLAHHSSGNTVRGNKFEDGCGDAIRLRDGSGDNLIANNVFIDFWAYAPISDWYCDSSKREDCTLTSGECPSFNNVLSQNKMMPRKLRHVELSATFGADKVKSCVQATSAKRFVRR